MIAWLVAGRCWAGVETISTDGAKWVASTWGYSAPKLLYNGKNLFAVGLVGTDMDHCVARLFWRDESGWHRGAELSPVYQPATMVLDAKGYINVFATQRAVKGFAWRSKEPGEVREFEPMELPQPEKFAYGYLGVAVGGERVVMAGLDPQYNLWLTVREGEEGKWQEPVMVAAGQKNQMPWDSPVYPILLPDAQGVDVVYSNSPDGGVHNTYNRVEMTRVDWKSRKVVGHEVIAQGPVGEDTFELDATRLGDGTICVLYFAGLHVYGDVAADIDQRRGVFCAFRSPDGKWRTSRVTEDTPTGQLFYEGAKKRLWVLETDSVGAKGFFSDDGGGDGGDQWGEHWKAATGPMFEAPGEFLQVMKRRSGSVCDDVLRAVQSTKSHDLQYIELTVPKK